jgi:hypothetical protein
MEKVKISVVQRRVLVMMTEGWELGLHSSTRASWRSSMGAWLQNGGMGKGGASLPVSGATLCALSRKGLIEESWQFPWITWGITGAGRDAIRGYRET